MKSALLKAQAKKKKYLERIQKIRREEDSDGYLSSDDEEQISDSIIGDTIDNQFVFVKYLGRGTFSKTWMVYNYIENMFYALKLFEKKFYNEYNIELENFRRLKGKEHPNIIKFYETLNIKKMENYLKVYFWNY